MNDQREAMKEIVMDYPITKKTIYLDEINQLDYA